MRVTFDQLDSNWGYFNIISGQPLDLSPFRDKGILSFDLRIPEQSAGLIELYVSCTWPCGYWSGLDDLVEPVPGEWTRIELSLRRMEELGLILSQIDSGFEIGVAFSAGKEVIELANIEYFVYINAEPEPMLQRLMGCSPIDDTDGDGKGDLADAFPDDPAASRDLDRDGAPDEWNEFATQEQIDNSPLHLDAFPEDPAASVDTDFDGMPDDWNEDASETDIGNSELIIDEDDDNDGIPDVDDPNPLIPDETPSFLEGTWVTSSEVGTFGVGPSEFDTSWWSNDESANAERACYFDDEYTFAPDGSFKIEQQDYTWREAWQAPDSADGCGMPVSPHDGLGSYTWEHNQASHKLTLNGQGAFVGLPKVTNSAELSSPDQAPPSNTYNIYPNDDGSLTVTILVESTDSWWQYKMIRAIEFVDTDLDGVADSQDAFPNSPAASVDTDMDGMPDDWNIDASSEDILDSGLTLDEDDDNDGIFDYNDAFPTDPAASLDNDYDGMPDDWNEGATEQQIADSSLVVDDDDDNDGIPDATDPFPLDPHYFYGTSAQFSLPFGGAVVNDDGTLIVPAEAESFAGFANSEIYSYPMLFTWGGKIYLDASVPSGGTADIRFRLERLPYDESDPGATEPSYETETITIAGAATQLYIIDIPPLGPNTYESLILYIETRDEAIRLDYPYFEAKPEPTFATLNGVFGGFIANGDYFEFPSTADDFAGVANTNDYFYPIDLPGGGTLSFMAEIPEGGTDTSVYFRFENAPYPDNTSSFDTDPIVVSGGPKRYTIDLPAKGWEQSFGSFLMYIIERDQGVIVWDVSIDPQYDIDSDGDGVFDDYDAFPDDPAASVDSDYDGLPDDWNYNATAEQIANSLLVVDEDDDNDGIPDVDDPDPTYPNNFYNTDAEFTATFGGAQIQSDGSLLVPAEAISTGGFVNTYTDQYPMRFTYGGQISFDASVPSGGSAELRFRFERGPYDPNDPDATEPSFETETVTISGSAMEYYQIEIPPQGNNLFESLILYIDTPDVAVNLYSVLVDAAPEPVYAEFSDAFGGFIADTENSFFEFPGTADNGAGVANANLDLYPISFPYGGEITFMAQIPEGGSDTSLVFGFEYAFDSATDNSLATDAVLISGGPARYTVQVPPQGWEKRFYSFLMYILERDQGVLVWDVEVHGYFEGEPDSDGDGFNDSVDAFPYDPAASVDTDGDGRPDDWNASATEQQIAESTLIVDTDDDNDGVEDSLDSDPTNPNVPNMSLSGTVFLDHLITLDGDTNNDNNPYHLNDDSNNPAPSLEHLQSLGAARTVVGYLTLPGLGAMGPLQEAGDLEDYYSAFVEAGSVISLAIAEPDKADIDLWLYDENGAYIDDSSGKDDVEFLTVPSSGLVIINAHLFSGYSNYVIDISPPTFDKTLSELSITEKAGYPLPESLIDSHSNNDVGEVYVLLVNANTGIVDAVTATNAEQDYAYRIPLEAEGDYFLIAGTDTDNDLSICDPGEACGVYPSNDQPQPVTFSGSQGGLDFQSSVFFSPEVHDEPASKVIRGVLGQ